MEIEKLPLTVRPIERAGIAGMNQVMSLPVEKTSRIWAVGYHPWVFAKDSLDAPCPFQRSMESSATQDSN